MIERVAELNRVLIAINELMDEKRVADEVSVLRHCGSEVIEGRMPDHAASVAFAERVGFLRRRRGHVILTPDGEAFLQLNPERLYDLSIDQKRLLIRGTFLHGPFRLETRAMLKGFNPAPGDLTFRWSPLDGAQLDCEPWLLEHLRQVDLIVSDEGALEVNAEFVDTVADFLAERKGFTAEQLDEFLRERNEVGAIAESLVLEYETERLRSAGHEVESRCIRPVSRLWVDAGYDIQSFNGRSPAVKFDRFIEVKGSRGAEVRFIWSENEMAVAKAFGRKYWLYFQGGIDPKTGNAKNKPLLFQDPIESVLKDGRITITRHGVIVHGKLRGEALGAG